MVFNVYLVTDGYLMGYNSLSEFGIKYNRYAN